MITIFNRSELLVTHDMAEFARVRDILASNGVDYECRTVDLRGPYGGSDISSIGLDPAHVYEYVIYVRGKDLDEAVYLMNKDKL